MEYLNQHQGHIDHRRYAAYLETIRGQLPAHVYAFAANPDHFDFQSHSSLHDSWLESFCIHERGEGERSQIRSVEISLCLLGAFQDRRIHLHYTGVRSYEVSMPSPSLSGQPRDLFTHEVRAGNTGLVIHELEFAENGEILIECADFKHSEELIGES
jgi:hypothetical protein